ncbi:hypothetical protein EST62_05200 [Chlorobaculum sp. 24CR]|nr:hypothetical protein EST62_05200 [Chlorobaculum sp. 24CR]
MYGASFLVSAKTGCRRMAGVSVTKKYTTPVSGYETGCLRPGRVSNGGACLSYKQLMMCQMTEKIARSSAGRCGYLLFLLYIKAVNSLEHEKESYLCHYSGNRSRRSLLR